MTTKQTRGVTSELMDPLDIAMLSPSSNPKLHKYFTELMDDFYGSDHDPKDRLANTKSNTQDMEPNKPEIDPDTNVQDIFKTIAGVQGFDGNLAAAADALPTLHDIPDAQGQSSSALPASSSKEAVDQAISPMTMFPENNTLYHDTHGTSIEGTESDSKRKDSGTCMSYDLPYDDEFATLLQDIEDVTNSLVLPYHTDDTGLQAMSELFSNDEKAAEHIRLTSNITNEPQNWSLDAIAALATCPPEQPLSTQPLEIAKVELPSGSAPKAKNRDAESHPFRTDPTRYSPQQHETRMHQTPATVRSDGKQALMEEMSEEQSSKARNNTTSCFDDPVPFKFLVSSADPTAQQQIMQASSPPLKHAIAKHDVDETKSNVQTETHEPFSEDAKLPPPAKRQRTSKSRISASTKKKKVKSESGGCIEQKLSRDESPPNTGGENNDMAMLKSGLFATSDASTQTDKHANAELPKPQNSKIAAQGTQKKRRRCWRELNHLGWDKW